MDQVVLNMLTWEGDPLEFSMNMYNNHSAEGNRDYVAAVFGSAD
jgi:hypothetical protein